MLTKTKFGLTGNQLKLFALLCMTVDHVGLLLFPQNALMRYIGRLAMPIFAWMIAEGCQYTKNRLRYFLTMFLCGAGCQIVYWFAMDSLNQCILITFSLSILLIYSVDYARKKRNFLSLCVMGAVFAAVTYISVFLPGDLPNTDFRLDYGIYGIMLPVLIYICHTREEKLIAAAAMLAALAIVQWRGQWFALLSLSLLAMYSGQRGKLRLKYLFYIYYPLHLLVIYGIGLLMYRS